MYDRRPFEQCRTHVGLTPTTNRLILSASHDTVVISGGRLLVMPDARLTSSQTPTSDVSRRLTTAEVLRLARISRTTLWRRINSRLLPPPIDQARSSLFDEQAILTALARPRAARSTDVPINVAAISGHYAARALLASATRSQGHRR